MQIFTGIKELVTLASAAKKSGRNVIEKDLSIISDAAIVEEKGRILWVGSRADLVKLSKLKTFKSFKSAKRIDLNAECVMPAFVECHTHLVFGGDRHDEFEMRNTGSTYQEIAKQGGGIRKTVAITRKTSSAELLTLAQKRSDRFLAQGVTTLEVKSGYGLNEESEIKILQVAKKIKNMRVIGTYLGPHAVPEGHTAETYLAEILNSTLPKIRRQNLAERADMFVEDGYFNLQQANTYFQTARSLGFRLTAHADQLTRTGVGAQMSYLGADSADHLIQVTPADVVQIAKSETTAVLLPTSDFYLKMAYPPARQLLDQGARVALATDFNPGTAPTQDLSFVGVLARLEMKMKLAEVICAYTLNAATALNRQNELGSIEIGKLCDLTVFQTSWRNLFFEVGCHPVHSVYGCGKRKFLKKS